MRKRDELRELMRTAHHEAGHAVIAAAYGFWPYKATITRSDRYLGEVRIRTTSLTFCFAPSLTPWMLYTLAGIEAQDRYSHRRYAWLDGGAEDIRSFKDNWYKLHILTDGRCGDWGAFERLTAKAVKQYWYAITAFAGALMERGTLEDNELDDALEETIFTDEYHSPPATDGICPCDPSTPIRIPQLTEVEAEAKALRVVMEGTRRGEAPASS